MYLTIGAKCVTCGNFLDLGTIEANENENAMDDLEACNQDAYAAGFLTNQDGDAVCGNCPQDDTEDEYREEDAEEEDEG